MQFAACILIFATCFFGNASRIFHKEREKVAIFGRKQYLCGQKHRTHLKRQTVMAIDDLAERYVNFYTDFAFKKLFGTEVNKELLISFLNSMFNGQEVIKEDRKSVV